MHARREGGHTLSLCQKEIFGWLDFEAFPVAENVWNVFGMHV